MRLLLKWDVVKMRLLRNGEVNATERVKLLRSVTSVTMSIQSSVHDTLTTSTIRKKYAFNIF